jgi:TatD DNase family protein
MYFNAHTHHHQQVNHEVYNLRVDEEICANFSIGIHPWDASEGLKILPFIEKFIQKKECIAIGETGLDRIQGPDLAVQEWLFLKHIDLSETYQLPLIVHCVRAWNELKMTRRELNPSQYWIYHGISKASLIDEVLQEGFILSIGANVLTNEKLQAEIKGIPFDQLLIETDDSLVPIENMYHKIAELKGIPVNALQEKIERTFKRIFSKWNNG